MKVLFYTVYMASPHWETELELMQNHLDAGDEVFVLQCTGELKTCFFNPSHSAARCYRCKKIFANGISLLDGHERLKIVSFPHPQPHYPQIPLVFENIAALKSFRIGKAEVGLAAASSLVSRINKEHNLDTLHYQSEVYREVCNAFYVYETFTEILNIYSPDLVYIFNGRLSTSFPAVNACETLKIPFYTHERGATKQKYSLTPDSLPHDRAFIHTQILSLWEAANADTREEIAGGFFKQVRNRVELAWYSYTGKQKEAELPLGFDTNKRNITFFNSTIQEYAAVRGWEDPIPLFGNEKNAFEKILKEFQEDPNYHFYIRVHPNLSGLANTQNSDIAALKNKYSNVTIIPPESKVDTYALMEQSDLVITFLSTIGVEACYWRKPSILLGHSFYEKLDCSYYPESAEELYSLIRTKNLAPKPILGALKYGYWSLNRGIDYKHFNASGVTSGSFKGKNLQLPFVTRAWTFAWDRLGGLFRKTQYTT